ncbi:MAG TPA: transposase [Pirellulales bacterium]|jgi:transposase|nr:transposase [Pirellulales bacterium]
MSMNAREQRGLIIAALCKLKKSEKGWLVPSQTGAEQTYRVDPSKQSCTCPDHTEHGHVCKHVHAVKFTIQREYHPDGTMIETKEIILSDKKTYRQNWPAYNRAQSIEKDRFQEILADLCSGLKQPERKGVGRKPNLLRDSVFAMALKVYGTLSARRTESDMREAVKRGFMSKAICGMKVCMCFDDPSMTPILKRLIVQSSLPLRTIETKFAIDSSGFSSSKFVRWFDIKYGVTRQRHVWVKAHIATGVNTNVITAVRILDRDAGDSPQLPALVQQTAENFTIDEVSADKAYSSVENFEAVADCGGTAFLAFRSNTTGKAGGIFGKMFHYFQFRQQEFMARYHLRSNVESTFSMIKRKFGDAVRCKNDVAMVNEVLCKMLCHNICCLIQAQCELGIVSEFWRDEPKQPATIKSEPTTGKQPESACQEMDLAAIEWL